MIVQLKYLVADFIIRENVPWDELPSDCKDILKTLGKDDIEFAILNGNLELLKYFIAKFAEQNKEKLCCCWMDLVGKWLWKTYPHLVHEMIQNEEILEFCISKNADNWGIGLEAAARINNERLTQFFIEKGGSSIALYKGLEGAAKGGHVKLVERFVALGSCAWHLGLLCAIQAGCKELVDFFLHKISDEGPFYMTDMAIKRAISFNQEEICKFLWYRSREYLNETKGYFALAVYCGRVNLVEFFISQGESNWGLGLENAADGNRLELVDYFLSKIDGRIDCDRFEKIFEIICIIGNQRILEVFLHSNDLVCQYCFGSDEELFNIGMCLGAENGHWDIVNFFVKKGASDWDSGFKASRRGKNEKIMNFFRRKTMRL